MCTLLPVSIVLFVTFYCPISGKLTCHNYNPSVNGTQSLDDFRCPKQCDCQYCKEETGVYYNHEVYCSSRVLNAIPSRDTVPTDVKSYHLDGNDISTLKNDSFQNLTVLRYLDLSYNNLYYKNMDINAFLGLQKLIHLSMDYNQQLYKLLPWFDDLVSLEQLHLQYCGLTTIYPKVLNNCKKVITIDLSRNSIKYIDSETFQNLPVLKYLYLKKNQITVIAPHAFKGSLRLQGMTLGDNLLTTIIEDVGLQNLTQLQFIEVAYNKFMCDCDLVWFRKWIGITNVTIQETNHTTCQFPGSKKYKNLLNFDPDKLNCSKLNRILEVTIPCASAGLIVVIMGSTLYRFRFHLRYWNQQRRLRKQYQRICNQGTPTINGEDIRYDVFICYNSKDIQWVLDVLQPTLEKQRNFKLCVDYRDFLPGEAIAMNIANAVKFSRKVLLVVSKHFAKSEWCNYELEMARMRMFDNHEDILIVVLLGKVSPKDMPIALHKILTTTTYIEWKEHPERKALFWTKLETALLSPNCPKNRLIDS
ncbi:toll-like receptor 2 type-1 [Antedon mediterranea]|uniref:toll-like receptor 2 type-1 n=1 Tax=Antedon mediterranea TaxID=105859 RepID=UPI003AF73329